MENAEIKQQEQVPHKIVEFVNHEKKKVYKMKVEGFSWKMLFIPYIVTFNKGMYLSSMIYLFTWLIPFYNIYTGLMGNRKVAKHMLKTGWLAKTKEDYKELEHLHLVDKHSHTKEKTIENNDFSMGV